MGTSDWANEINKAIEKGNIDKPPGESQASPRPSPKPKSALDTGYEKREWDDHKSVTHADDSQDPMIQAREKKKPAEKPEDSIFNRGHGIRKDDKGKVGDVY